MSKYIETKKIMGKGKLGEHLGHKVMSLQTMPTAAGATVLLAPCIGVFLCIEKKLKSKGGIGFGAADSRCTRMHNRQFNNCLISPRIERKDL